MKLALLFHGDGRSDYLRQAVQSVFAHVHHPITARLMVNDEADPAYCAGLDAAYPEYTIRHTGRVGMARAVQAGFDLCVEADVDAVLWIEEDFTVDRPLPITDSARVLDLNLDIAQMLFQRQPLTGEEHAGGSVASGFPDLERCGHYGVQSTLFSLNPCLIPKRVLQLGYDLGNEAGQTNRLRAAGYRFGVWLDGPLVTHIGAGRSDGWKL